MISAKQERVWPDDAEAAKMHSEQSLSAFMDGEGSAADIDFDAIEMRQTWSVYHLIGDSLRERTSLAPVSVEFSARITAALAREAPHGQSLAQTAAMSKPVSRWRQAFLAWPGVAVAAAVVSVVWVAQPLFGLEQDGRQGVAVVRTEPAAVATRSDPVRPESDYVSAHRQMAGPIAVRQVAFAAGAD